MDLIVNEEFSAGSLLTAGYSNKGLVVEMASIEATHVQYFKDFWELMMLSSYGP